jgi:hypothetical protein
MNNKLRKNTISVPGIMFPKERPNDSAAVG